MTNKNQAIDALKTVLGTMVQEPIYDNNVGGIIGEKQFSGRYVQKPIVEGTDRDKVKKKLLDIIDSIRLDGDNIY